MASREDCRALIARAEKEWGRLDILVNNAGLQHVSPVEEFPEDRWEHLLRVMLIGPFLLTKYALPLMYARGWGRIINMSSLHGLVASPYKSAYISAKHGLMGLTKTVALEAADKGVTVNAVCPSLRAHAAGGEADRRPGAGARPLGDRGHREDHAGAGGGEAAAGAGARWPPT